MVAIPETHSLDVILVRKCVGPRALPLQEEGGSGMGGRVQDGLIGIRPNIAGRSVLFGLTPLALSVRSRTCVIMGAGRTAKAALVGDGNLLFPLCAEAGLRTVHIPPYPRALSMEVGTESRPHSIHPLKR